MAVRVSPRIRRHTARQVSRGSDAESGTMDSEAVDTRNHLHSDSAGTTCSRPARSVLARSPARRPPAVPHSCASHPSASRRS